ncbi:Uncharacterised protein [Pantoea agglomerans]|uniref:Metal-dependent hydrolase n=1 Tax=Enterobacter agglomerans TaxID=549 RepID=A0A379LTA2_ENTAG|nr:Uncharacterised protein [Pantoea agglomerans]
MKLTQIRNATLLLDYAGKKFLIDPMLAEKEAWPGFAGNARPHLRNPMVELPVPGRCTAGSRCGDYHPHAYGSLG